jgi:hypothetical protein
MNLFHEAKKVLDKDGKVNPLGPYGKMKLTGREVSTYFRRNKVSDPEVKKAVEVALDMSGAMDIAAKEIKKFFGDKILKSKEVQSALKYANEETVSEGKKIQDIVRKHKRELQKAQRSGNLDLSKKAEDELSNWASSSGEIRGDDEDEFIDWLDSNLDDLVKGKIKESTISENYRVLAKHGMGAETKNSIKVGTEIDYYQADGAKYMGKVTKMGPKSYIVRDDKTKKNYQFMYHDRVKAKKYLKQGDNIGESYLNMFAEEMITYRVKGMQKPEEQKFIRSAKMMGLKITMDKGKKDTVIVMSGTKKKLRDFDAVARGKSSYGDPSTISHFDEK